MISLLLEVQVMFPIARKFTLHYALLSLKGKHVIFAMFFNIHLVGLHTLPLIVLFLLIFFFFLLLTCYLLFKLLCLKKSLIYTFTVPHKAI